MRRWAAEAMPPGASLLPVTCNTRGSYLLQAAAPDSGGAPYRKYHSTRHSFATWLLEGQPSRSPRMHALNFRAGTPKFRGLGDLRVVRQGRATLSEIPRDPPHVRHVAP